MKRKLLCLISLLSVSSFLTVAAVSCEKKNPPIIKPDIIDNEQKESGN
jgi:hypothetical protein